jgi:hypothetical protein
MAAKLKHLSLLDFCYVVVEVWRAGLCISDST